MGFVLQMRPQISQFIIICLSDSICVSLYLLKYISNIQARAPPKTYPHFQTLCTPNIHFFTHTHTHTCPCKSLALPLSAGCLTAHWLHSSRPQSDKADVSLCACLRVYWYIVYRLCRKGSVYVCLCEAMDQRLQLCVSCFFFFFWCDQAVSVCFCVVQKAQTADGFNACGRLMCA